MASLRVQEPSRRSWLFLGGAKVVTCAPNPAFSTNWCVASILLWLKTVGASGTGRGRQAPKRIMKPTTVGLGRVASLNSSVHRDEALRFIGT